MKADNDNLDEVEQDRAQSAIDGRFADISVMVDLTPWVNDDLRNYINQRLGCIKPLDKLSYQERTKIDGILDDAMRGYAEENEIKENFLKGALYSEKDADEETKNFLIQMKHLINKTIIKNKDISRL